MMQQGLMAISCSGVLIWVFDIFLWRRGNVEMNATGVCTMWCMAKRVSQMRANRFARNE